MTGDPTPRPSGCQPCPSGHFQEMEGQLFCTECPRKAKSRDNREATVSVFECEGITRLNWSIKVVISVFFTEFGRQVYYVQLIIFVGIQSVLMYFVIVPN